mmetsp:Transcript_55731/g.132337  ORF Transcript_55731/g.132337 Transcript_55731/m.132337 type:complete len:94 (+) Transcript_55731:2-283(+)
MQGVGPPQPSLAPSPSPAGASSALITSPARDAGGNQEIEAFFSEEEAEEDQRSHPALGSKRGLAPSMLEDEDYEGSDLDALSRESKRARSSAA